eukprot:CAMPEP_0181131918 /NCGR_PEP_ID=MMETSP1071-20121207/30715_1 /TAXON_ID=35127 /ORGANISM="Thalassiosira sp., Strain NH16" /LENGTH=348 /DNA_ID=CAMNT_0023218211 /DNA_START=18 /DNA_END=1064 /DNA_ORIENTATION=+
MSSLPPRLSPDDIACLLDRVDAESELAREELTYAQPIAQAAGLTVHSSVIDPSYNESTAATSSTAGSTAAVMASAAMNLKEEVALAAQARHRYNPMRGTLSAFPLVLSTTGGHCNTDHVIHQNPDGTVDRLSEYKRTMKRRFRQTKMDERGSDRWDLPRIPGGRRRRIKRDADAPSAPPEPPYAGYIIYLSQMTTKLRHDNPDRHHDQIAAVRRISAMWKKLKQRERDHYQQLCKDARIEYEDRMLEYRATGAWSPFTTYARLENNKNGSIVRTSAEGSTGSLGPLVRIPYEKKNDLEKELETYEQVIFPPRPLRLKEEHEKKVVEREKRRREKIRGDGKRYKTTIMD